MKKLTALTAIILSISGYSYADNLCAENKKFIESVLKKQFPKAKYNKVEKYQFYLDDDLEYRLTTNIKEITTQEGKIRAIALNEYFSLMYLGKVYLYAFKKSEHGWKEIFSNITEKKENEYPQRSYIGKVVLLGKEKLGFELKNERGASHGLYNSTEWLYRVGNQSKILKGCIDSSHMASTIDLSCQYKIRTDLS